MGDVCKEKGSRISVCALTRCTGLSLAESILIFAARRGAATAAAAKALVGDATSFFSYSWTGTRLVHMLDALERQLPQLEAAGGAGAGGQRYVWIDMVAASQNLLAGVYRNPSVTKAADPAGYAARKVRCHVLFVVTGAGVGLQASLFAAAHDGLQRCVSRTHFNYLSARSRCRRTRTPSLTMLWTRWGSSSCTAHPSRRRGRRRRTPSLTRRAASHAPAGCGRAQAQ